MFLWSLENHWFREIFKFDTNWVIPISFKFLQKFLKNIFEVYGSNYFHGVGKKYACFIFLSFLNEVTSLQYQVIKDQRSWGLNTNANQYELYHYYVSNILQRIKRVIKMWWYKLFFSKYVFEQNIIFLYER